MMNKIGLKRRLLALLLVAAIALATLPMLAMAALTPATWAKPEVDKANTSGLLSDDAAADFERKLTRAQYCELVIIMVEQTLGRKLPLPAGLPFSDTRNEHVLKAFQYNLVDGVGEGKFNPDGSITREQIATLMVRALLRMQTELGRTLLAPPVANLPFNDANQVQDYARESMRYAVSNNIFQGDNFNNVNPLEEITSQECVVVNIRTYEAAQQKINASLTTSQLIEKAADNIHIGYALGDLPGAVSQNVILPTTGAGGTQITWSSTNPNVIDANGRVITSPGGTATLTATLTLGGLSRVRTFTLTTTNLSGDRLLVQNAKAALELSFANSGDSISRVTGRVFLPATIMGLPVSWSSDNPSIVSVSGDVTTPNDSRELSVTLRASFHSGTASDTKAFALKVRNPAYSSNEVSLHNITLGMTAARVTEALGAYKTTLTLASGERWQLYYTSASSYNNFIAVAFQSDRVIGVYSMVQGWDNYLRDAQTSRVITVAEANAIEDTSLTVYTDSRNSGASYAAFLADTSTKVDKVRSLAADGAETFTLALINAFRAKNGRTPLARDSVLSTSARQHSADMGQYDYFSATGRSGSTYQTRANAAATSTGGSAPTVEGGFIANNTINPFNYLDNAINSGSASDRAIILSASAGTAGVGYAGGYSGAYHDLLTAVFGSGGSLVTGAVLTVNSIQQTGVSVSLNGSQNVTLTLTPSGATENITVRSSNTNVFTLTEYSSWSSGSRTYTVTGRALTSTYGAAYIYVYGADNRLIASFPVTVGSTYATGLTVRNEVNTIVTGSAATTQATATATYVIGMGNTYQFTATPTYSGSPAPVVTWSSSAANIASVNSSGTVSGSSAGAAVIYASVPKSDGTTIRVAINVRVVNLTLSTTQTSIAPGATTTITASLTGHTGLTGLTHQGFTWQNSNNNAATITGSGTQATVTGKAAGTTGITATATFAASAQQQYIWKVTRSANISVVGQAQYPTGATLSLEGGSTLGKHQTKQVIITPNVAATNINVNSWTSSNMAVATVGTDGKVTGIEIGSATISGYLQTGASSFTPVSFSVTVTDSNPTITVSPAGPLTLTENGSPATLTYVLDLTYDATQFTVVWAQSSGSEANFSLTPSSNSCMITPLAPGDLMTVCAEISGTSIKSNLVSVTITPDISTQPGA
ncbi:MAG: Ig-like domain-containing protein [Oscillospiraceae bacterium]|jgi:uncharacterized protein YkwD/uncharacterized protein YjdB|nr:Ig-like domain-containing protein [Oscillospiraceae bacterium]